MSQLLSSLLHNQAHAALDMNVLPRRYRYTAKLANNSPVVQGVIQSAKKSTWRLIRSFDKLEREVWGCASQTNYFALQLKKPADPVWSFFAIFGDEWWDYWKRTHQQGGINVFREAPIYSMDYATTRKRKYQGRTQFHLDTTYKYGMHLCTGEYWGPDSCWNIKTCMERLDMLDKEIREGLSPPAHATPTSSPAVDVGVMVVPGESWSILADEAHGALPKEVKIAYKTKDGKTQYTSFVPASPGPGHDHPIPESATSGSSGGEQGIKDLETDPFSSDASQPEAHADTPVGEFNDNIEGAYDVGDGVTEVREGGDVISICSLD